MEQSGENHAVSLNNFEILQHAYTSAWLRHHHPAEYFAALLTEDPGMWPRSTLVQEARRKGVGFARVRINLSGLHYQVGRNEDGSKSVRVPLTSIKAVSEKVARKVVLERLPRSLCGCQRPLRTPHHRPRHPGGPG